MQKVLGATCIIAMIATASYADKGNDWRAEYDAMTQKEKDAFNKTRADIKSKVNEMSNEEREAFKKQIESQHGVAAGDTIYIEAIPQDEDVEGYVEPRKEKETGWKALSFEEKRQMYLDDKK